MILVDVLADNALLELWWCRQHVGHALMNIGDIQLEASST